MTVRQLLARRPRKPPTITHPDRRVSEALEVMRDEGLTSIPVIEKGELIAMVSLSELVAAKIEEDQARGGSG